MSRGERGRWLLGAIVVAVLVVTVVHEVDWSRASAAARSADPLWLLVAIALNWTILLETAARWLLFMPRGAQVSPGKTFEIVAVSTAVGNVGPMLTGQAAGMHLLATRGKLGHAGGLSVTILDQLSEGVAKIALVAAAILLVPGFPRALGAGLLLVIPLSLVAFVALAWRKDRIEAAAARRTGRTHKVIAFLASTAHQLDALRSPTRFVLGVALKLLQKTVEGLAIAAVALSLGVTLPAWVILSALVAVNLSTLVAVTPGNLGGYEGSAYLVYRAAGVESGTALAFALIQHTVYLIPLVGTGGVLEAVRLWRRVRASPAVVGPEDDPFLR